MVSYWDPGKVFDNDTLLPLYPTFVYPYLHYCIHVWGKAYNTHLNDLVVLLQNKARRIISGVPPRTNIDIFYVEINILTVKRIYNYSIGLFMYKYVNKMTPDVFDNFFRNISDIHQYNTRNATQKQFYITYRGTTRGQKTFSYCGPYLEFHYQNINKLRNWFIQKMPRQLFPIVGDDVIKLFTFMLSVVFLARCFIAGCTGICHLTTSSVAGGGRIAGMMAFFSFCPFGVRVQFMERLYVCVYIKNDFTP